MNKHGIHTNMCEKPTEEEVEDGEWDQCPYCSGEVKPKLTLDDFAESLETIENLCAAMTLPMPAQIHLDAFRESLPELHARLKSIYIDLGGEDHWKDHP